MQLILAWLGGSTLSYKSADQPDSCFCVSHCIWTREWARPCFSHGKGRGTRKQVELWLLKPRTGLGTLSPLLPCHWPKQVRWPYSRFGKIYPSQTRPQKVCMQGLYYFFFVLCSFHLFWSSVVNIFLMLFLVCNCTGHFLVTFPCMYTRYTDLVHSLH
jgi:hypothetical protein